MKLNSPDSAASIHCAIICQTGHQSGDHAGYSIPFSGATGRLPEDKFPYFCRGRKQNSQQVATMTVVAAYTHDGYIYLFGDLLLSDTRDDRGSIELPASGSNPNLKPHCGRMSELRQKIVVIAPYCAIGFAGDVENAQKLFQTLKLKADASVRLSCAEILESSEEKICSGTRDKNVSAPGMFVMCRVYTQRLASAVGIAIPANNCNFMALAGRSIGRRLDF